jgi:hypothetical protein
MSVLVVCGFQLRVRSRSCGQYLVSLLGARCHSLSSDTSSSRVIGDDNSKMWPSPLIVQSLTNGTTSSVWNVWLVNLPESVDKRS